MPDITDSRRNSVFTFLSTATEKLENRNKSERRGRSYLHSISGGSKLNHQGMAVIQVVQLQIVPSFSLHKMTTSLLDIFRFALRGLLDSWLLAWECFTHLV